VTLRQRVMLILVLIGMQGFMVSSALAQNRGAITIRYSGLSPFIALLAGILILIIPRLLNFIVAIYLIIVGLIGIFGL
jgi:Protein of unknown function (DUF3096)